MKKYNVIILGTDIACYSIARSYNEAFGEKAIVCGQSILAPFRDSKIADIYLKENFSTLADTDEPFVEHLNEVVGKNPAETNIIFVPYEEYFNKLLRNKDRLNFDMKIPYPNKEMGSKLIKKSEFYKYLDTIDVNYPKTQIIGRDNIEDLSLEGDLFAKADNYEEFENLKGLDNLKKGYKLSSNKEAIETIKEIYEKTDYSQKMVVQEYINGGDGSELSINGYRAKDGKITMALCRSILSDHRDMWVGNHLVQIDHEDDRLYDIAQKIVDSLDYHGLFNIDFKIDSVTGKIYVFEVNVRQGRTFYFSTLSGINLMEAAVKDLVFEDSIEERPTKKFMFRSLSEKCSRKHLDEKFLDEFDQRADISLNPLENKNDNSLKRRFYVNRSIKNLEKQIYG